MIKIFNFSFFIVMWFGRKWELALCRICGSQGIHMACGQLKWANPIWECKECISILGK